MTPILRLFILLALVLSPFIVYGQNKTILVEHFTNTRCPICKANNPAFYNLFNQYKSEAIHIAYHPSVPYSSCVFYQANTAGNGARQSWYNIFGTPTAFINGKKGNGNLPSPSDYNAALQEQAILGLAFEECTPANVRIKITALTAMPEGKLIKYFAALTEKHIAYAAPNGETDHWDVFRQFLNHANGGIDLPIPPLAKEGDSFTLDLGPIDYPGNWNIEDFNIVVFAQDANNFNILQAVKSEILLQANNYKVVPNQVNIAISPNPASDLLRLSWSDAIFNPTSFKIYNVAGIEMQTGKVTIENDGTTLDIGNFPPGKYYIHIIDLSGKNSGRGTFIKH